MYTTHTKPRLNTPRQKSRSSPSSPGNHKSRRNVRQIQNQLDSLRTRQNSSVLRNSVLIADISRLKQQVSHMNVSFNKLERARNSYDRYVETCMVSWIQKVFRESGTNKDVSSSYKPEPEPTESAVQATPTKTIGIQTTQEHQSLLASDWSISPETESQLLHSTMLIPTVSSKPPRDTSQRHSAPSFQTRTDTSLVPPIINFSDLRATNMPPDATLMSSYDQSNFSVYPRMVTSHPESPVPPVLSTSHLGVPQQPVPSNSTPTQIPTGNFNPAFHSFPNVSMIAPQEGVAQSQHSFALPQQPMVYVNMPNIRPQFQTNQGHNGTHSPPPNATIQSSVNPLVETTLPLYTNFQPMNFSQGQTNVPQNDTFNTFQEHLVPPGATFQLQTRFPGPNIPSQIKTFNGTIQPPANPQMEFTLPETYNPIRQHLPLYANFQPPTIPQAQYNMAPNLAVQTPSNPQVDLTLPENATSQPPISIQEEVYVSRNEISQPIGIPITILPPSAISEPPMIPQIQPPIGTLNTQPATISREPLSPSIAYNPDTIELNKEQVTQPLHTSDIRTLSPQSSDPGRHQVAQPLRHNLSPQTTKQAPPPPIHSSHYEPQLSHSRQPSTLPTIPEPQHETGEMSATYEPPPAATNTSIVIPRVPSAQDFQLQHLVNLERRATLDLGERPGSEFDFKFSLNPSVSIAPTDTSNIPRHNSASSPTLDTLDNGMVSEASSEADGSKLESSRNQFDLTAGEISDEEIARKPSHIMVDMTATSKPLVNVSAIKKIGAALNAHCHNTTISGGVKIYDSIGPSDAMKGQISESSVIANRILSQAVAPESNLASWDVQTLGATFLSEISKYVRENGPIITGEMLLLTSRVDLESFNRLLVANCQDLWRVISEHFASLIEAKLSADEICVIFTPYLMKANSSSEDTKKGSHILVGVLNEMFDLEVKRESFVELTQEYSSDSESDYVAEKKEEAYLHLLKSMTTKSVDTGVKSGLERDDIMSIPSSIVSEGSADVDLDLMVPSVVAAKNSDQSPTQLLDEAVGEKIELSDSDSVEEPANYVPDFGGSDSMSDRERKKKLEKLWGTEPDSGSEAESVKPPKKKDSLDDFDF